MKSYLDLLTTVLKTGVLVPNRTGIDTVSTFGLQFAHDFKDGFPILTTKKIHWKSVVGELLWFLDGSSSNNDLRARGVSIWDEWATEDGELGPIYGVQWRRWLTPNGYTLDQMSELMCNLKNNPHSRRHVVSAWNVADLPDEKVSPQGNVNQGLMSLAPCHCLFQFYVTPAQGHELNWWRETHPEADKDPEYFLSCHMYQRSADLFLGVPFNIASYALLTHLVAHQLGMVPKRLTISFGDLHLYMNHMRKEIVHEQLSRKPRGLPGLILPKQPPPDLFSYDASTILLDGYSHYPAIRAPIAV